MDYLIDTGDNTLLMHGLELSLFSLGLLLQSLDGPLESLCHLLLELLGAVRVLLAHLLVLVLKVGPVLHHLVMKNKVFKIVLEKVFSLQTLWLPFLTSLRITKFIFSIITKDSFLTEFVIVKRFLCNHSDQI